MNDKIEQLRNTMLNAENVNGEDLSLGVDLRVGNYYNRKLYFGDQNKLRAVFYAEKAVFASHKEVSGFTDKKLIRIAKYAVKHNIEVDPVAIIASKPIYDKHGYMIYKKVTVKYIKFSNLSKFNMNAGIHVLEPRMKKVIKTKIIKVRPGEKSPS